MATSMGKGQETKNIIWPTNWKRNAKRRISKESMIDSYKIMISVSKWIRNNRDEEVCRRWDVLADEDHTYHLSEEEYFYYKNKWWLHLNKSGSDTLPMRKRSDFKPLTPGRTNNGSWHRVRLLHGGNGKTPGGLLKKSESQRRGKQKSWEGTGRPVVNSTLAKTSEDGFQEFNLFCYR